MRVTALDAATVLLLFVLSLFFARPLLEEWGLAVYFDRHGLGGYPNLARNFPLRPLQAAPSALQWALGGGAVLGFAIGFGLLLVAKYAALRWAVGPYVRPRSAWLLALMGAVLVPWAASWRLRYSGADLSAVFLFLALGGLLRCGGRVRTPWTVVAALGVALMLATYQALAVCAAALPLVALVGLRQVRGDWRAWARLALAAWTPVALGAAMYGVYGLIAVRLIGSAGYEGTLDANGEGITLSRMVDGVRPIYRTAYSHAPWTLLVFSAILAGLVGAALGALSQPLRLAWLLGLGTALLLLPLAALPYVANTLFLGDPDRIGFPVAVGFALVATAAVLHFDRAGATRDLMPLLLAAGLVLWTLPLGNESRSDYETEAAVLRVTDRLAGQAHAQAVLVQDYTGRLGDVYLLYGSTLQDALTERGSHITSAVLCTPTGVDRIAPDANALQIGTTPRCDQVPASSRRTLLLNVVTGPGGGLVISPAR